VNTNVATAQARVSAADRREQILEAAAGLFAQQGLHGTTTKQISERTGVTEALIFRHFASKEELYWAVIERKIRSAQPAERLRERLRTKGSDLEVFSAVAADILERRAKDQTLSRLLLYSALENHELSHRFFGTYIAECYGVLTEYARKAVAAGRFRPVDPLLAARAFLGMVVYHSWVQELFGGKRYQRFSVQQVSRTLAEMWLQGVSNEKPGLDERIKGNNGNHSERHKKDGNGNHHR